MPQALLTKSPICDGTKRDGLKLEGLLRMALEAYEQKR